MIEILETVTPTEDLVALCRSIQHQGYSLALDDFMNEPRLAALAGIAGVIKVDMRVSSLEEQEEMIRMYKPRGVMMLAEKVETYAEFQWALDAGYELFQGYFFARPEVVRSQHIPANKAACLRLLREVRKTDLDFQELERLIRQDLSLTYQLLRYANSAMFQRGAKIQSIARALMILGERGIRSWVALATLPMLATNKPSELVKLSLIRARFCEQLAEKTRFASSNEAFLMGMFSLLDALIDRPLDEALRGIELGKEITEALLGIPARESVLACLYQLICCYELGNWEEVERLAQTCGIPSAAIGQSYVDSTTWAEQLINTLNA